MEGISSIVRFAGSVGRFVLILGAMIFVHELGHFLVAKWRGIRVFCFSLGFGPRILGFTARGTEYRLSLVPLGGYVKMAGQEDHPGQETDEEKAVPDFEKFSGRRTWEKIAVIAAGPIMNVLSAVAIFTCLYTIGFLVPSYSHSTRVGAVLPDSPAVGAGIVPGDSIVAIDGRKMDSWNDIVLSVLFSGGDPLDLAVAGSTGVRHCSLKAAPIPGSRYLGIGVLPYAEAVVVEVTPGSVAAGAGIEPGDRIEGLDGKKASFYQLTEDLASRPGEPLALEVDRGGRVATVSLVNGSAGELEGVAVLKDGTVRKIGERKEEGDLADGDRIVEIDGREPGPEGAASWIASHPDRELTLTVLREGEATPRRLEIKVRTGRRGLIGVVLGVREIEERVPFPASLIRAAAETEREINLWFWSMAGLIRGDLSHKELTGPIGIYQETEKFAERGPVELFRFIASISIIIGLVNLLPIPVLDGGNILIIAVEGIIRRPLGERTMAAVQYAGLGLIAMIFLLVFYNDIVYRILGLE